MIKLPVTFRSSLCGGGYFIVDARGLVVAGVTKNIDDQHGWALAAEAHDNVTQIVGLINAQQPKAKKRKSK